MSGKIGIENFINYFKINGFTIDSNYLPRSRSPLVINLFVVNIKNPNNEIVGNEWLNGPVLCFNLNWIVNYRKIITTDNKEIEIEKFKKMAMWIFEIYKYFKLEDDKLYVFDNSFNSNSAFIPPALHSKYYIGTFPNSNIPYDKYRTIFIEDDMTFYCYND